MLGNRSPRGFGWCVKDDESLLPSEQRIPLYHFYICLN